MRRATRVTGSRWALWAVLAAAALSGCSGSSRAPGGREIDPAIAFFVSGQYEQAIDRFNDLAGTIHSDETLRELYYYLGRSYLALGETDRAIDAFSAGVSYGDRGACIDYLEQLQAYVETRSGSIRRSEDVTRRQLAAGLVREAMGEGDADATIDDPDAALRMVVARGWMKALPDGALHGDAPVTRASLYVIMSRVARELGVNPRTLDEYRATFASRGTEHVTGPEVATLLSTLVNLRKHDGG